MSDPTLPPAGSVVKVDPANPNQQHVIQISATLDENRALELDPVYISLGLPVSAFPKPLGGAPATEPRPLSLPKSVFNTALRAGPIRPDLLWLFRGDSFYKYTEDPDGNDELSEPIPFALSDQSAFSADWPASFATRIDAALSPTGSRIWFFRGSEFFRLRTDDGVIDIGPAPISEHWIGLTAEFTQGIDAAIHGVGNTTGIVWLFKGSRYQRYNMVSNHAENAPLPIAGNWGGDTWPATFADGIDFAFYGTGAESEKIYFFRGDQYILYNLNTNQVEDGPNLLTERWRKLATFIAPPQLFLVEQYAVRSFRGEMGLGPSIEGLQINVPAGGITEFFILTKKSETISQSTSTNILESQSDKAIETFSESTRNDNFQFSDRHEFGYHTRYSFAGEAKVGAGPGPISEIQFQSEGVRNGYNDAVTAQTSKLANKTQETHKQQVTTQASTHVVNQEIETGLKQTIDNRDNPNSLNILVFQLTQEYILVLSLVDAKLEFHNNDPRDSETASIRDMENLLERVIVAPEIRAQVKASLIAVLKNIEDVNTQIKSLIIPTPVDPTRFQVDRRLTSQFEVKDSEGNTVRTIVVPGVLRNINRRVVLTTNTIMVPAQIG